jgi:hypothetical protein
VENTGHDINERLIAIQRVTHEMQNAVQGFMPKNLLHIRFRTVAAYVNF